MLLLKPRLLCCASSLLLHPCLLSSSLALLLQPCLLCRLSTLFRVGDTRLALASIVRNRWRACSCAFPRSQYLEHRLKTARIVLSEIHMLHAARAKGNRAISVDDWDNCLLLLQREGNLVHDIRRTDRGGRENHHHARAIRQSIFDRAVPSLAGKDVQLIQPHARPGRLQVSG